MTGSPTGCDDSCAGNCEVYPVLGGNNLASVQGLPTDSNPKGTLRRALRLSRWQLFLGCYSLLGIGLALQWLFSRDLAATVAYAGAVVVGGYPAARGAWRSLTHLELSMNALVLAGAAGAIYLGLWEEAAALVAIYSLGGLLEAWVVDRAQRALRSVEELAPRTALRIRNGVESRVYVELVEVGDILRVRPGDRIPVDGLVLEGHSAVDESSITGEPIPVDKGPGDPLLAGTMNHNGGFVLQVTARAADSTLAQVMRAVQEARKNKSRLESFGQRFASVYTPAMFAVALVVAIAPGALGMPWLTWFYRGLVVLVISCSCGLIMSGPVATLAAVTSGARRGLVIKGGAFLEAAESVDVIVLDKTGTLTRGRPEVRMVSGLRGNQKLEVLQLAAAVESGSEHPLALAVSRLASERGLPWSPGTNFESTPGNGASAEVSGRRVWVGSPRWAQELNPQWGKETFPVSIKDTGTPVAVWDQEGPIGLIMIADAIRPEARAAVQRLRERGLRRIVMLTGDGRAGAEEVAAAVGITEVIANLRPVEKAREVARLQSFGFHVAFVGDGINDAPALAQADLGIAMGLRGTELARATCDVILMEDNLARLPEILELGGRATRIMRQNVVISIAEVFALVAAALVGLVGLIPAIALNEGSALAVVANGLRLLRFRSSADPRPPSVATSFATAEESA